MLQGKTHAPPWIPAQLNYYTCGVKKICAAIVYGQVLLKRVEVN